MRRFAIISLMLALAGGGCATAPPHPTRSVYVAKPDIPSGPFHDYDVALKKSIYDHWRVLLDRMGYYSGTKDRNEKVTVRFNLQRNGMISDLEVVENTAGPELSAICESAIRDVQPFRAWTVEMQRLWGRSRGVQITFCFE